MPKIESSPLISIILVTWNSATYLPHCLESLSLQTFKDFEVIVVDNGSTDGTLDDLESRWSEVTMQVLRLGENKGFAAANNLGARLARGQWLALLNPDAFPAPEWLEQLLHAAESHPQACFASRQVQAGAPHLLDGEGDAYHVSGLTWRRGYGLPVCEKAELEEVFSPCAAAALYPCQAFLEVGGFDEEYFAYQEDVDLGFRLRLQGRPCYYVPGAVVQHVGSASTGKRSAFVIYHGHRNLVWTYFKDMPPALFWTFLPLHLVMNLYSLVSFTLRGQGRAIWRAKREALLGLGAMLRKRKEIQRQRRVSAKEVYRLMEHDWLARLKVRQQRRRSG